VQGRAKSSGPFWPTFQTLRAQAKSVFVRNGFCGRNHGFIMVLELSSSTLQTTIFGEKPLVLLIFVYMDAKKSD